MFLPSTAWAADVNQPVAAVTATSSMGDATPDKVADMNTGTSWQSAGTTDQSVTVEYAAPFVATYYYVSAQTDGYPRMPQSWTVEGSKDGAVWVTLDTETGLEWDGPWTYHFFPAEAEAMKYYRLGSLNAPPGQDWVEVAEFQMMGAGPEDPPPPGPTTPPAPPSASVDPSMDKPISGFQTASAVGGALGLFTLGVIAVGVWRR
jgi:hypothetical protein